MPVNHAARIIDANANRAREALRVMEDAARFLLGSRALAETLKTIRHEFASAMALMPGGEGVGIAHRDTPHDVGTGISTESEYRRQGVREVVIAAAKRLTEALRSIEEFAKSLPELRDPPARAAELAARIEQLRYRSYAVERRLLLALGAANRAQWNLCVLITERLCTGGRSWLDVAIDSVHGGADCIQLREPDMPDREVAARARRLVEHVKPLGASIVVNDRPDIAVISKADAVHLGQHDLTVGEARMITGFELLIGVSTSNRREAEHALRDGADYCGMGPMFPSATKPKDHIAGPEYVREYLAHDPPLPPHLAIGGITPDNASSVIEAGARGLAVSSCVCAATDPGAVCHALREAIDRARARAAHAVDQGA